MEGLPPVHPAAHPPGAKEEPHKAALFLDRVCVHQWPLGQVGLICCSGNVPQLAWGAEGGRSVDVLHVCEGERGRGGGGKHAARGTERCGFLVGMGGAGHVDGGDDAQRGGIGGMG